ncbi:MAG: winged helix-turn-helix transcriptional regulator [Thermogutta sp.]|uniref:MarR family winged helix-turn-helix transcriptional regulator n=1 Tax=Thermogutta sp. TaxID=1962930 RepID=UPI0019AB6645|nr:MarR family winged helix-turn-helix transcriptional regulator [Thermogutta sp.]MBC7353791.1 winged helix-turn-helix transcriptional regulator [Thermogutta sp.]
MIDQDKWILCALAIAPLDRIRLMKTLFRFWWHSGQNIPNFFRFKPYLYGPWSPEVYHSLERLEQEGLIVRLPHAVPAWSKYHLTDRGRRMAKELALTIDQAHLDLLNELTSETSRLGFSDLLKLVYGEAPQFAQNSVVKEALYDADYRSASN